MTFAAHFIGRAYGAPPRDVRAWPEQDVDDELLLLSAEAAAQRRRERKSGNGRRE